jgi:hypothetical protein
MTGQIGLSLYSLTRVGSSRRESPAPSRALMIRERDVGSSRKQLIAYDLLDTLNSG